MACHFRGAFFVDYSSLPAENHNPLTFGFFILTRLGEEAVLVFFVLSGLLVGGKAMQRISAGTFQIKSFVVDRFVRIMLPLVSALLLWLLVCRFCGFEINWRDWFGSLFSVQLIFTGCAFGTLWSLVYEVWFYILTFALGVMLVKRIDVCSWKYGVGALTLLAVMLVMVKLNCAYLMIWILGAFALWKLMPRKNWLLYISTVVWVVMLAYLQSTRQTTMSEDTGATFGIGREIAKVVFGFSFAVFLQQIIRICPKRKFNVRINLLGTKLAAFSYTLYLTHAPVLHALEKMGFPKSESVNAGSIGLYFVELLIGTLVAYGIYLVFERNTATVKKYIKRKFSI